MKTEAQFDLYIEKLYEEMFHLLFEYALSSLGDTGFAEEAVQDTFAVACAKPGSLMSSRNPKGWLMNTLKYVIRNIQKTRSRFYSFLAALPQLEKSIGKDDFDVMYSDLLSPEDFALLKLVILQKYTMLEASTELGISVSACKKRLQRMKKKLKQILEDLQ